MLSVTGISMNPVEASSTKKNFANDSWQNTYLSEVENADTFALQRQFESLLSPTGHLPAPASKFQSADCLAGVISLEQKLSVATFSYLVRSLEISPALSVSTIIFPFHYFW